MVHRNYMGSAGGTCTEKGFACDHEEKLVSTIKRNIDPTTGKVISESQEWQAFYQCRHCLHTYQIGTMTTGVNDVVTFGMILDQRKAELRSQFEAAQATKEAQQTLTR